MKTRSTRARRSCSGPSPAIAAADARSPRGGRRRTDPGAVRAPALAAAVCAGALAGSAGSGLAQVTGSATLESQYVYRGLSLDERQPDLRVSLAYDAQGGAYAGLSGVAGSTVRDGPRPLAYGGYAGYARQAANGLTWDVGATATHLVIFKPRSDGSPDGTTFTSRYKADYAEVYVGLSGRSLSGRLYLSPDYLHQGAAAAYLDLNRSFVLGPALNGYLHGGLVTPLGRSSNPYAERERFDVGAGAAWSFRHAQLRLAWSYATPSVEYPPSYRQKANQVVVSAAHFF